MELQTSIPISICTSRSRPLTHSRSSRCKAVSTPPSSDVRLHKSTCRPSPGLTTSMDRPSSSFATAISMRNPSISLAPAPPRVPSSKISMATTWADLFGFPNCTTEGTRSSSARIGRDTRAAFKTRAISPFCQPPGATGILDPKSRVVGSNGQYTATPFTGNIIPANRLDPTSQKLLAFLPHANVNPGNSATPNNNLQIAQNNTVDKNQVTERGDYNQNSRSQWFGRFGWTNEDTVNPLLPQQGLTLGTISKQYMVSNAWVLSPSKVNEVRFGYTSMFNAVADVLSGKTDVVKALGLPFTPEVPQSWGVPAVTLGNGLSSWGDNTSAPFVINDKITQVLDNFSWNHGKHSIRFGGEYRYDVYNQYGNQYTRGNPQFNGNYTANPQNLVGGNSAADFVLGAPYRLDLALQLAQGNDTANSLAFYLDDTYKMTPKLTITAGLRWEMVQPWLDTMQNMTNYDFKRPLPNK